MTTFSIVIPTFNRSSLLCEAIESALAQTIACEVVVVDHGSTDDTPERVKMFGERIVYIRRETDDGPIYAWLDGVLRSTGDVVHLNYDDDWIDPTFAERTLAAFAPDVGLVFTNAKVVSKPGGVGDVTLFKPPQFVGGRHHVQTLLNYLLGAAFTISPGCATLRRKDCLEALMINPAFCPNAYRGAGPDLMIFLSTLSRYPAYVFIDEPLAFFRSHDTSITVNALKDQEKTKQLIHAYDQYKLFYLADLAANKLFGAFLHRGVEILFELAQRFRFFG